MLVALTADQPVTAWEAQKGPLFVCPKCQTHVTLKKGRLVAHHFAHKPPVTCPWGTGETQGHLKAKMLLYATFTNRGLGAAVEAEVISNEGDRRADVLVWWPQGRAAFEVQHQPLSFEAIDRRTRAYMAAGVPVIWLGLISQEHIDAAEITPAGRKIARYPARPWEKWAHTYGMGQLWFVDPVNEVFWRGILRESRIEVPYSSWYVSGGDQESAGGYSKASKRWRELHLEGPYTPDQIWLNLFNRKAYATGQYAIPGGPAAGLTKSG